MIFRSLRSALCTLFIICNSSFAQSPVITQDPNIVQSVAENFLNAQVIKNGDKVKITVNKPDSRLKLQACEQLSAFMPPGGRLIGRTTVGVRCTSPKMWSLFLPANVQVFGTYVAAANGLAAGQTVAHTDLATIEGEISQMPASVITDISQVVGQTMATNVTAGTALRRELIRAQPGVIQGQSVRVIVKGSGFQVTAEGRALQTSGDGQIANVKLNNGQTLSGTARKGGFVEVVN